MSGLLTPGESAAAATGAATSGVPSLTPRSAVPEIRHDDSGEILVARSYMALPPYRIIPLLKSV
jgi:hypothetical protein